MINEKEQNQTTSTSTSLWIGLGIDNLTENLNSYHIK